MHLDTLGKETSSIFLLHTRNHHAAPTSLPVNRRGHLASGSELEAVNHSEDFVEVSSCGGRGCWCRLLLWDAAEALGHEGRLLV